MVAKEVTFSTQLGQIYWHVFDTPWELLRLVWTFRLLWIAQLLRISPHFFSLLTFTSLWLISCHVIVMWSHSDLLCCDGYCSITSIVLWPIVQGDSIVPVTSIVSVTLLFSFTISTSSLWPYSLRLDFCILRYRQAIRVLSHSHPPCPFLSQGYSL